MSPLSLNISKCVVLNTIKDIVVFNECINKTTTRNNNLKVCR